MVDLGKRISALAAGAGMAGLILAAVPASAQQAASTSSVQQGRPGATAAATTQPLQNWAIKHTILDSTGRTVATTPPFAYVLGGRSTTLPDPLTGRRTRPMILVAEPGQQPMGQAQPMPALAAAMPPAAPAPVVYEVEQGAAQPSQPPAEPVAASAPPPGSGPMVVGEAAQTFQRPVDARGHLLPELRGRDDLGPLIQEIRLGFFRHDAGIAGGSKEEGWDLNAELLFRPFSFMEAIGSPRPQLGITMNTSGGTNQFYGGLSWQFDDVLFENVFINASLGLVIHDGNLTSNQHDEMMTRKELGARIIFRESLELGYLLAGRHSVSLLVDHISNANTSSNNEGLDSLGVRYGMRF